MLRLCYFHLKTFAFNLYAMHKVSDFLPVAQNLNRCLCPTYLRFLQKTVCEDDRAHQCNAYDDICKCVIGILLLYDFHILIASRQGDFPLHSRVVILKHKEVSPVLRRCKAEFESRRCLSDFHKVLDRRLPLLPGLEVRCIQDKEVDVIYLSVGST